MARPIFKGIKDATEFTGDGGSGCIGDGGSAF